MKQLRCSTSFGTPKKTQNLQKARKIKPSLIPSISCLTPFIPVQKANPNKNPSKKELYKTHSKASFLYQIYNGGSGCGRAPAGAVLSPELVTHCRAPEHRAASTEWIRLRTARAPNRTVDRLRSVDRGLSSWFPREDVRMHELRTCAADGSGNRKYDEGKVSRGNCLVLVVSATKCAK